MFDELLGQMEVPLDPEELDSPLTIDTQGQVVTVAEYVDQAATNDVKATLGRARVKPTDRKILPVRDLADSDLTRLTEAVLRRDDPEARVAIVGHGDFSSEDLITEVQTRTDVGQLFVEAVRTHSLFIEHAVRAEKVSNAARARSIELTEP